MLRRNSRWHRIAPALLLGLACLASPDGRAASPEARRRTPADLDGDGVSDIAWRNAASGEVSRLLMKGGRVAHGAKVFTEPDPAWRVVGDADFDGDGVSDLLWHNYANGQYYVMRFGRGGEPSGGDIVHIDTRSSWKLAGTPDLDGDGKADLAFRNAETGAVETLRTDPPRSRYAARTEVAVDSGTAWRMVATGDFSGTGRQDQFLWRHSGTGQVDLTTVAAAGEGVRSERRPVYREPDPAWTILGAADFDGDGRSDILWRNAGTGQVLVMLMNGAAIASQGLVHTEPDAAWKIVALGDYDGDGRADLLWRHDARGQVYLMRMRGLAIADRGVVYTEGDAAWKILGFEQYGIQDDEARAADEGRAGARRLVDRGGFAFFFALVVAGALLASGRVRGWGEVAARLRLAWLGWAACAIALLAWLSPGAARLALLVAGHGILLALPMAACLVEGARRGVREMLPLALTGLVGGATLAYAAFWAWLASPVAGAAASFAVLAGSVVVVARGWRRLAPEGRAALSPFAWAGAVWIAYAACVLALGLAPTGLEKPLDAVAVRYTQPMPSDNKLPYLLAEQVTQGRLKRPMVDDWLTSDRPPLQTAYFLATGASLLPSADLHYQVQATILQCLWVVGAWVLLGAFQLPAFPAFLALLVPLFSGFALFNGLYTWPKLLPVAFLGAATAALAHRREYLADWRMGAAIGAACAYALLCHGGSIFALIGIGIAALALRRIPGRAFMLSAALAAAVLLGAWALYQGLVDPPGNRLLKWHLAGVKAVDARGTWQTIRESYGELPWAAIAAHKLSNFASLLGNVGEWPGLTLQALTGGATPLERTALRDEQLPTLFASLGLLAAGPLALLLPAARPARERRAAALLLLVSLAILATWPLLLFGPRQALIKHGSLALVCFASAGCVLAAAAAGRVVAVAIAVLYLMPGFVAHVSGLPTFVRDDPADPLRFGALVGLAAIAVMVVSASLWKLCASSKFDKIEAGRRSGGVSPADSSPDASPAPDLHPGSTPSPPCAHSVST